MVEYTQKTPYTAETYDSQNPEADTVDRTGGTDVSMLGMQRE
jgi:hypothetical protein